MQKIPDGIMCSERRKLEGSLLAFTKSKETVSNRCTERDRTMEHVIYTHNEQRQFPLTPAMRALVKRAVKAALSYEQFPYRTEVSVTFTDASHIRALNAQYRARDTVTDVLSFPLWENIREAVPVDSATDEREPVALGDIVLCVERAAEQAEAFGHSLDRELAFLAVHSTLHLLGYDHERGEAEDKDMRRRQREVLHQMGLDRINQEA